MSMGGDLMSTLDSPSHQNRIGTHVRPAPVTAGAAPVSREDVQAQLAAVTLLCESLAGDPSLPAELHPLAGEILRGIAQTAALVDRLEERRA